MAWITLRRVLVSAVVVVVALWLLSIVLFVGAGA